MPPTPEMIERANNCIFESRVVSFTATPNSLDPTNSTTTIAWDVSVGAACGDHLKLQLNGINVPSSGSRTFRQFDTQTYTLSAHMFTVGKTLRHLTVPFDASSCVWLTLTEQQVRNVFIPALDAFVASEERLRLRQPPSVEVTERGIEVSVSLTVVLDDLPDPKVNVAMTLSLSVRDGAPVVTITRFSVHIDLPWWVTFLTAGLSEAAKAVVEDAVEGRMRRMVAENIENQIRGALTLFPGQILHAIVTRSDSLSLHVCRTT